MEMDDYKEIIDLFEKDDEGKVEARMDMGRLFIHGNENELMLRFHHHARELIIARISFKQQRKGHGSQLLELLKTYAKEKEYHVIIMESVLTEEAVNFSLKHGFIKQEEMYNLSDQNNPFGNYRLVL